MTGTGRNSDAGPVTPGARVAEQLVRLTDALVIAWREATGDLPQVAYDPDWPSPCVVGEPRDGQCFWQPVTAPPPTGLERLGKALDTPLHPAWTALYTTQWAATLSLRFNDGDFDLLQLWNEQDADNLIANQIGHALEKRRVRQPLTLFFGLVDDARLLSIDNASGAVQLETLGTFGPEEVCPDLASFLEQCTPVVRRAT